MLPKEGHETEDHKLLGAALKNSACMAQNLVLEPKACDISMTLLPLWRAVPRLSPAQLLPGHCAS